MEICLECNQSFESKSKLSYHIFHTHNLTSKMYYDKHLKKDNDGVCLNCGRPTLFKNLVRGYKKSCCKECERKCAEITNKERYGDECYYKTTAFKKQRKDSMIKHFGVEHTLQVKALKEQQIKHRIETCQEKYGVNHNWSSPELREQRTI